MIIELYYNKSDPDHVNKNIEKISELNGNLKNSTSIISPTIRVQNVPIPTNCNYCYIPQFNRYYYITDITLENNNIKLLSLNVDVLMSFKTQFINNRAIISRSQNNYNLYLNDDKIKLYSDKQVIYKNFPNSISSVVPQMVITMTGVTS